MKTILVTGGREWTNKSIVWYALMLYRNYKDTNTLIHGACRGLDLMAAEVAVECGGFDVIDSMPAEWRKHIGYPDTSTECKCSAWRKQYSYCSFAGPRRNRQMLDKQPDIVLAFHPNIAKSRGTKDCVNEAVRRGIPVVLFDATGHPSKVTQLIP